MSQKPTLVFVPGAWHDPVCFTPTTTLLSQAGYKISPVSLPSIGSELHNIPTPQDWTPDISAIRSVLLSHINHGEDVLLIVHSYSGTVGSEACRGLSRTERAGKGEEGGVVKLVYLCALVLDIGHWIWEATGDKPISPFHTTLSGDLSYAINAVDWFYNKCSPEEQAELPKQLKSHAWKTFLSKVDYTAWRDIDSVYLMCENDHGIPIQHQEAMLDAAKGHRFVIERCDADHSPFVSRAEVVAEVIRRAAGERV